MGLGVDWIDHRLPFHRSARGTSCGSAEPEPTAMHARSEMHDTAARNALEEGRRTGDHRLPFQRSAYLLPPPTAMQAFLETHDTPPSASTPACFGTRRSIHRLPFHHSASG